jgi:inhibitor of cysteine peptidase
MRFFLAVSLVFVTFTVFSIAQVASAGDSAEGRLSPPSEGKEPLLGKGGSAVRETPVVGKDSVWNADKQMVQTARQKCAEPGSPQIEECFPDAMLGLGASADAVSFTRSFGGMAYARRFREAGRVDVAYVVYPFRANENHGFLLVNGEPAIVDVDDTALLPKEAMEQDKTYITLKRSFPRVTLWPGDRSPKYPTIEPLLDGAQSFVVPYTLRNFCHACEVIGTAFFCFDFDRNGRLIGVRFQHIELPPRKPAPKIESPRENEQIRFVVMVEEGKEFTIRLSSNPTTGYRWKPAGPLDDRTVRFVRSQYTPFEGGGAGSGGEESWTFLAVNRGDAEITMEYVRPWEKTPSAVKTATIKVSVRPSSQR